MITFLRKIRKSLIDTGGTKRYALYAIGEILLVVIGILIALQINTWNERNKEDKFQNTLLKEIQKSLVQDSIYIGKHIPHRISRPKHAVQFFNRLLLGQSVDRDSIDYHFRGIDHFYQVTLNKGPYEALKYAGLDKVRDDSLRSHLINVYEYIYPRYEGFLRSSDREREQELKKELRDNWSFSIEEGSIIHSWPDMKEINYHDNQSFLELLKIAEVKVEDTEYIVDDFLVYIKELISHLDTHLDN